jgi:hypothetical protein
MKHGLLPTSALLDLFEIVGEQRVAIVGRPREAEVLLEHATHGKAVISDNSPLTAKSLERCLDDGLRPADWLKMLNERVFFWVDRRPVARLLDARINRDRARDVLVVDTLSLARCLADEMDIAPINTGAPSDGRRVAAAPLLHRFGPIRTRFGKDFEGAATECSRSPSAAGSPTTTST